MIYSKHGVRLTATECRLELNNGFTTLRCQPLCYLRQQQAHSLRYERALIESNCILIL